MLPGARQTHGVEINASGGGAHVGCGLRSRNRRISTSTTAQCNIVLIFNRDAVLVHREDFVSSVPLLFLSLLQQGTFSRLQSLGFPSQVGQRTLAWAGGVTTYRAGRHVRVVQGLGTPDVERGGVVSMTTSQTRGMPPCRHRSALHVPFFSRSIVCLPLLVEYVYSAASK